MKGGLSLGMIVGQVLFGLLSDTWGRQAVYGRELMVTLLGTLLVILLPWNGFTIQDITAWISIFRVLTGVGIGAGMSYSSNTQGRLLTDIDYPLSSALSVESISLGTRAVQVLSVFAFIGVGNYAASIVFLVLLRAFKSAVYNNVNALEWVWRLLLGIGMVPAALTLYARLTLPETKPYTKCKSINQWIAGRLVDVEKMWPVTARDETLESRCRTFASTLVNGSMRKYSLQRLPLGFFCKLSTMFSRAETYERAVTSHTTE